MEKENSFTWKIRMATLSVFLLGFLAGALSLNAYYVWFNPAASTRQERFEKIFDQLDLNESQKTDVQRIMKEAQEEFKNLPPNAEVEAIRSRADEKAKKVFTPEQWEKFVKVREEFREAEKNKK